MSGLIAGLVFSAMLGAALGSFANVVLYRLPRGIALHRPSRSFCPSCRAAIAWYDNIPVISWLVLSGRCRRCGAAIAVRYPLVELLAAMAVVGLFDAFFVARVRAGLGEVSTDWPIWLAHVVLMCGLIAAAAIDIEHYCIDLRITWVVVLAGVIGQSIWTPSSSAGYARSSPLVGLMAVGAVAGLVVSWSAWFGRQLQQGQVGTGQRGQFVRPGTGQLPAVVVGLAILVAMVAIAAMGLAVHQPQAGFALRATLTIGFAFAVIVAAGLQRREADREVIEAIEQQRHQARRQAARELAALLPAIGLAAACGLAARRSPAVLGGWMAALDWSPLGQWRPISGLATSLAGFALAGAIGWTIRLLFTLLLGKEAFGLGDIHLMAAAGAVAGWQVVLIGFVVAAPLALAGVVLLLARKRSQAIPFGPWLGLGVWVALLYHDAIVGWVGPFLVGGLEGLRLLAAHLTGTAR